MNPTTKEGIARGLALLGSIIGLTPLIFGIAYYEPPMITFVVKLGLGWRGEFSSICIVLGSMIVVLAIFNLIYTEVYRWSKMILK